MVETLIEENIPRGKHSIEWNAAGLASGVYYYRLQAGKRMETRKLILLK